MGEHLSKLLRVYVWERPVRIFHWVNAFLILVLCVTGYMIGNPPALMSQTEPSFRYFFGWVRFIHFAAAYLFFFNFIIRIYWGFVGNKYANWRNYIPTNMQFFKNMWHVITFDIFLLKGREHLEVGHNALAGFTYFILFLAFLIQCLTGFALYASMSDWWFADLFVWVEPLFGGDFAMRNWHHATMWFFIVFAVIHIYLCFFHDYVEGRGVISSIIGGWKFVEEEAFLEDERRMREEEEERLARKAVRKAKRQQKETVS